LTLRPHAAPPRPRMEKTKRLQYPPDRGKKKNL
jgi:hypothetical protein